MSEKLIKEHNDLLRRELGTNPSGDALYRWERAGELTYLRDEGKYDYKADPNTGLVVPEKILKPMKMCPHLDDKQWVLMFWTPNTPAHWFQFGKSMYGFSNVDLDLGVCPWTYHRGLTFTDHIIGSLKEQRKKTYADFIAESEARIEYKEKQQIARNKDMIADAFTAYYNVPGKRGHHVSFGGASNESRLFGGDGNLAGENPELIEHLNKATDAKVFLTGDPYGVIPDSTSVEK